MKERPVIFSAPMVRAILEGRKTMTRRVVRWPIVGKSDGSKRRLFNVVDLPEVNALLCSPRERSPHKQPICPYGIPGDRLWVREAFCYAADPVTSKTTDRVLYRATDPCDMLDDGDGYPVENKDGSQRSPWESPIYMPRAASRLTLEVVSVRVERSPETNEWEWVIEFKRVPKED